MVRDVGIHRELSALSRDFTVEALAVGRSQEHLREALKAAGRLDQRRSPLQPHLMMWLVLSMAVFRQDSIPAVLARLLSGLRDLVPGLSLKPVTEGALAHARKRLGVRPVRGFFRAQAADVQPNASFHGLRVWSLDGSHLTMPDTPANLQIFGRPTTARGQAAFPQLKWIGLQDAVSRRFRDVAFRPCDSPERPAALKMLGPLGEDDLLLLDRGFYAAWFFEQIQARRAHFLCRIPDHVKLRAVNGTRKSAGDYDAWIEARLPLPQRQVRKPRTGPMARARWVRLQVRVVEYHLPGFRPVRLATDLCDRNRIPALDLARQYHRRWDIELGLDEVKTHQSSHAGGTLRTIFRSKTPRGVMQEAYALFAAYNLVRATIQEAAERHTLAPDHISFVDSLRVIGHMLPRMRGARAAELPRLYRQMLSDMAACRLDRPRRPRGYPRVVRVKMSNFKLKRSCHRERILDSAALIRVGRRPSPAVPVST